MRCLLLTTVAVLAVPRLAEANCDLYPNLCGLPVSSSIEQPNYAVAIDVVLVGDGYTDGATWATKAGAAIDLFKAQSLTGIYGSVPDVYNFHVVEVISQTTNVGNTDTNDTALGMYTGGSVITAHAGKVSTAALNAPDVDITIAIANGSGRANANMPNQLASGGRVRLGTSLTPISHEMGHAVIGLGDEYEEASLCNNPSESALLRDRNLTADPTCRKFETTPGAGCVQGGHYCSTGVFRSASGCLMRSSGNVATCPVCKRDIRETLVEKLTGRDIAEPWVVPTSPRDGDTVSGIITLRASLYDHFFSPTDVAFDIDGAYLGTINTTSTSASLTFDTRTLVDGSHVLTAFADDAAGHARRGTPVTFDSLNGSPSPLTAVLTVPVDGATVFGSVSIYGNVSGGAPAYSILEIDGQPAAVSFGSTLWHQWDTIAVADGPHTLELVSLDVAHQAYGSGITTVTVDQSAAGSGQPGGGDLGGGLSAFIDRPASWSAVGPELVLEYAVYGGSYPIALDLLIDGQPASPNPLAQLVAGDYAFGVAFDAARVDASSWSLGPHLIEIFADDGTLTAVSNPVPVVRADPGSNPVGLLSYPHSQTGWVSGSVTAELSGYDDVAVTELALFVDGVEVGTTTTVPGTVVWDTTVLPDGSVEVAAEARDAEGNTGRSASVWVYVDNTPPTIQIDWPEDAATLGSGVVPVQVAAADDSGNLDHIALKVDGAVVSTSRSWSAGSLFAVLAPGTYTLVASAVDGVGLAEDSAPVSVTIADCTAGSCDDADACTTDVCAPTGTCLYERTPNCCGNDGDCDDDDPCTADACATGSCTHAPVSDCCDYGYACEDGDICTLDVCSAPGNACSNPDAGCCTADVDCDDSDTCTTDTCLGAPAGWCVNAPVLDCCTDDTDCDDGLACTTDSCDNGACDHSLIGGCCEDATDCDDGDVCTWNQCVSSVCRFVPKTNCCVTDPDCVGLDPCVTASCDLATNSCTAVRSPGCCTFDFECDDRDPCTEDICDTGACTAHTVCCLIDEDCDDLNPCTTDACDGEGFCQATAIPSCCVTDDDCNDGDVCTTDACTGNTCTTAAIPDCCADDADCDDSDVCTDDACIANTCSNTIDADCCLDDADCDDSVDCSVDQCLANRCEATLPAGCCIEDADCDDSDACTTDTCDANSCTAAPIAGCCVDDADCDDGDVCTADTCHASVCDSQPISGCDTTDGGSAGGDADASPDDSPPVVSAGCACRQGSAPLDGWLAVALIIAIRRATRRRG